MEKTKDQSTLHSIVLQAAEAWVEHSATDELVLTKVQQDTIACCASILFAKGFGSASLEIMNLLPRERLAEMLN